MNPILVEVWRGLHVESAHRGAVFACDAEGRALFEVGDVERPVFPRSAVKAIQALPLVESGAADAYGFGDRELALACASHSGEEAHVALAAAMLERAGLAGEALECGVHWPGGEAGHQLALRGGKPTALHNNCSGKHSGFLCACRHSGMTHPGYVRAEHPIQREIAACLEAVTGAPHGGQNRGVDGCSIPTYAVPLKSLALGFARMAAGKGMGATRAAAARQLLQACMAEPFLVAGTGRADTRLMELGGGRVFTKTGAEGVYCAALPELGIGIALKCDDGASRAAEAMVAAMLAKLLPKSDELADRLRRFARPALKNWNKAVVGEIRPAGPLA